MSAAETNNHELEQLLEYLRQSRGFDFTGYKRPSLMRRIVRRMQTVNVEKFPDYLDYLEVHPEEFTALFNTILINVTGFFRDEATWKLLEETILPQILAARKSDAPIRIWSAGCASGEEAYTLALLMAEALGKSALHLKVKIYATDVDEEALTAARQATYNEKDVQAVPAQLREKYFEPVNGRYVLNGELRRAVIFGRHDLVQDAPMSHLDLLVCRNTMMYFNTETQSRILRRFNYAINPGGFLFLGRAEMLLIYSSLYVAVDLKHRIFSKVSHVSLRDRPLLFGQGRGSDAIDFARYEQIRDAVFESGQTAQIVIDDHGNLIMGNEQARQLYGIAPTDLSRPFRDLELSYQPAELRSLIDQVYEQGAPVTARRVEHQTKAGDTRLLDIHLAPLSQEGAVVGVCVTFFDVSEIRKLEEQAETARMEIETANEELQTTNEELQSTNEELETTNEELQSTNEELETMNEELQSTNEELQTINDELRQRTDDLNHSNDFLASILGSLRGAVIVVDQNFFVLVWNPIAEALWGLRLDEVKGQSLMNLDIGFPVGKIRNAIQACIADGAEKQDLIFDAVNRRGRNIKCRVSITAFTNARRQRLGAILVMEEMGM